jgi:hypothetical protein
MALRHHNLVVWQRADDLFIEIHQLTHKKFPREEKYELSSQMRRAAYSVPANIVEGTEREHPRESLHFCSIASRRSRSLGMDYTPRVGLGTCYPPITSCSRGRSE